MKLACSNALSRCGHGIVMLFFVVVVAVAPAAAIAGTENVIAIEMDRAADADIVSAYVTAADGFSVDEIMIDDARREAWLDVVEPSWRTLGDDWQTQTLLRLLSLRKAGKLPAQSTRRGRPEESNVAPIAEIAARSVLDRHPVSSDVMLCDPRLRAELQQAVASIVNDIDPYDVRKSVLRLRKTRKLVPELVLRVAEWDRVIETFTVAELETALAEQNRISESAGVYLFRDASGYLYIGEAVNLHQRLSQHVSESDRLGLRQYLESVAKGSVTVEIHRFGPKSPANSLTIRRAYESELIRSRQPKLNVRP